MWCGVYQIRSDHKIIQGLKDTQKQQTAAKMVTWHLKTGNCRLSFNLENSSDPFSDLDNNDDENQCTTSRL